MKLSELKQRLNTLPQEFLLLEVEIENTINGRKISTLLQNVTEDGLLQASDALTNMDEELPKIYELWINQGKKDETVEQYVCDLGLTFHTLVQRPWGVVWSISPNDIKWFTRYAGRQVKTEEYK